jgi:hypothetical protein
MVKEEEVDGVGAEGITEVEGMAAGRAVLPLGAAAIVSGTEGNSCGGGWAETTPLVRRVTAWPRRSRSVMAGLASFMSWRSSSAGCTMGRTLGSFQDILKAVWLFQGITKYIGFGLVTGRFHNKQKVIYL